MLKAHIPFFFASAFFVLFLVHSVYFSSTFLSGVLLATIGFLVLIGLSEIFKNIDSKSYSLLESVNIVSAHVVGAAATFFLVQQYQLSSVVSAALVGLAGYFISSFLVKYKFLDLAPNVYCGTFVGMASASVITIHGIVGAGALSGLLFIFLATRFNGCGGKLGSIAFMSCVLTIMIVNFL